MADKKVMLTEEGYNKLVEKLNYLKSVKRIEIAERLKAAIALGDLSENSESDAAKNEQPFREGGIQDPPAKLRNSPSTKGEADAVRLVGSTEAAPGEGKISNESPLGQALLGQKSGSVIDVHAPAGIIKYEILAIKG